MNDSKSAGRLHSVGVLVVAVMASGSLIVGGFAPSLAAESPTTATNGSLRIRVADSADQGISAAKIHVSIWTKEKNFKANRDYTCEEHGQATVELPATLEIVRVWARGRGYAPMFAQLWPQTRIDGLPLPKEFTFALTKGTTMGGVIRNDDGQPIQGARVEVSYEFGGDDFKAPKRIAFYRSWRSHGR
jgi:hypothetical protein